MDEPLRDLDLVRYVTDVIDEWLRQHGYDGITCGRGCGCGIGDLVPCDEMSASASPAVMVSCGGHPECDGCAASMHRHAEMLE